MKGSRLMLLSVCWLCAAAAQGSSAPASLEFFAQPLTSDTELSLPIAADPGANPSQDVESEPSGEDPLARTPEEIRDALSRRIESLADELSAEGHRSGALVDELAALAALYQEQGDHLSAIGALDWALENSRFHNGLYSLEHALLLEQMIESHRALDDRGGSASLEARLIELVYRNRDDPRVTTILAAAADRRMDDAHRILEEGGASEIVVGVSTAPLNIPKLLPSSRYQALASLRAARRLYSDAIWAGVRNGNYAVLDLLELEERMVSTLFIEMSHPDLSASSKHWLCHTGEAVLKNSADNIGKFRQAPTSEAAALIRLADWQLLCSANGKALDTYDSAYASLLDRGAEDDTIAEFLSPQAPVALPAFAGPLNDEDAHAYDGYIDVSFVIGKYGSTRGLQILDESPGTTRAIAKKLTHYIARHRFRPQFSEGALAGRNRVAVRYYYRY